MGLPLRCSLALQLLEGKGMVDGAELRTYIQVSPCKPSWNCHCCLLPVAAAGVCIAGLLSSAHAPPALTAIGGPEEANQAAKPDLGARWPECPK